MIVYLHGFASTGGASQKVRRLRELLERVRIFAPTYSHDPALAVPFLESAVRARMASVASSGEAVVLIGTGLGGFYALYLQHLFSLPTVLINPLLWPQRTLRARLGENTNYKSGEHFLLSQSHLRRLEALGLPIANCSPDLLLLDEGDQVVEAAATRGVLKKALRVQTYPGGSHRFGHLDESVPLIESLLVASTKHSCEG